MKIGVSAFHGCKELQYIELNNGLEVIGGNAFYACKIKSITMPKSVTKIGQGAFAECRSLENADIRSDYLDLDDYVFSNCINLKTIVLPDTIIAIPKNTFSGCKKLF